MGLFNLFKPNVEKMERKRNVEGLMEALVYKKDWHIRRDAAEALGRIKDERAVEPLIQLLKDENLRFKAGVIAEALGEIGDKRAVEPLIQLLKDEDEDSRKDAVEALGKIGDARAIEPLISALNDESRDVREEAEAAWEKLIGGKRAVVTLIQALKAEDSDVRAKAADTLGDIGDKRAVDPLIPLLKDEDERVQLHAVDALGEIGDERAVEPLIPLLKDENLRFKAGAIAEALGEIGDKRAVDPLIPLLKDEDEYNRKNAVEALGKIGDARAVESLILALKDKDEEVREEAVRSLFKIGDLRATEAIIDLFISYPSKEMISSLYSQLDRSNLNDLFGDYTDIIFKACLGTEIEEDDFNFQQRSNETVGKLCNISTQISNNILHKISKRKKVKVAMGFDCSSTYYWSFSFISQREKAKDELKRRGNPPYDPSIYLDKEAWKL